MGLLQKIIVGATVLGTAQADWQFRSRPDLAPPRLNITIPATRDVSPGYIFVGPYPGFDDVRAGPEQAAGYIFTNDGDLVWSSLGYFAGWVGNLQAVQYQGKPALQAFQGYLDPFHGHGYGTPILLDDHYKPIAMLESLTHRLISIHEFKIVNEKTALVEIYQPTAIDLTPYGGTGDEQWIAEGIFQEIDIATGKLIFEGHTLDWASPADSVIPLRSGRAFTGVNASDAWDYFHINSVDKDDEGNYLVSGRHTSTLYKINGSDGSLIWQLGGKKSTFSRPATLDFGYQHDARFLNRSEDGSLETISFFDNSARSDRQRAGGVDRLHPHSRARIVQLNHDDNTATEVQTFIPPDMLSVSSQGNVQVLDSGNVFVNWGQEGAVTEFTPDGTAVFHAYLDSGDLAPGVQSYRGFRYPWTGYSSETPALVVSGNDKEAVAYVSWNGDTVAKRWRFYYHCGETQKEVVEITALGEVEKKSFESSIQVSTGSIRCQVQDIRVFAQAVGEAGDVLSTSYTVGIMHEADRAAKWVEEEDSKQYPFIGSAGDL
ncbi:ASST-domain-containing protein [Ilyonectria sp. MPI-CAGE-AT-0026]|nr:ASST-domain-containing protein [Ilyonectria sp. MPI-CAGE-AT-0026]